jgi:hypothetical protein
MAEMVVDSGLGIKIEETGYPLLLRHLSRGNGVVREVHLRSVVSGNRSRVSLFLDPLYMDIMFDLNFRWAAVCTERKCADELLERLMK